MSKFPLCERAGLTIGYFTSGQRGETYAATPAIHAGAVEALLEKAPVVQAKRFCKNSALTLGGQFSAWSHEFEIAQDSTHTARLIMIEPIQRDTAESLLRELMASYEKVSWGQRNDELIERAKRLLEGKCSNNS